MLEEPLLNHLIRPLQERQRDRQATEVEKPLDPIALCGGGAVTRAA